MTVRNPERRRRSLVVAVPWPHHSTCGFGGGCCAIDCRSGSPRPSRSTQPPLMRFPSTWTVGRLALRRVSASVTILPAPSHTWVWRDRVPQLAQPVNAGPELPGLYPGNSGPAHSGPAIHVLACPTAVCTLDRGLGACPRKQIRDKGRHNLAPIAPVKVKADTDDSLRVSKLLTAVWARNTRTGS